MPKRPEYVHPEGEMVEEVNLDDYQPSQNHNAHQESDEEDDFRGGHRVGCAQQ